MRHAILFIVASLLPILLPEHDEYRIDYDCEPKCPIYPKTYRAFLDRIVLGAVGKEYVLRKAGDSPLGTFDDDKNEVQFETLDDVAAVMPCLKLSCKAGSR